MSWPASEIPLEKHSLYRKVDEVVRQLPPGKVLEIGCYDGRYLQVLQSRGWDVVGVDLQPQPASFILEHDAQYPFPFSHDFDLVIAVEVIEHIVDTEAFLRNCYKVLKKDGRLVLTTPNLVSGINRLRMIFGKRPLFCYADYHVQMFVLDDLLSKLDRYFCVSRIGGSHLFGGPRRGGIFVLSALLADYLPRLAAHLLIVVHPKP